MTDLHPIPLLFKIYSSIYCYVQPAVLVFPYLSIHLSSYFWGVLSDIWGRKPVLIISELLVGIATLAFGFSINFPMAIATRFAVGITNGKLVVLTILLVP